MRDYGYVPLSFVANQGQADPSVRFLSSGSGYALSLTRNSAVLALGAPAVCRESEGALERVSQARAGCPGKSKLRPERIEMTLGGGLAGSSAGSQAEGEGELPGKVNYLVGGDPAKWRTNLPTYAKVRYAGVYPGIDLVYYGNRRQLEYDFVVAPGADPAEIRLRFSGQRRLTLAANGDLVLEGASGTATVRKPAVYQDERRPDGNARRRAIPGSFRLLAGNSVGFTIGRYDRARALVIDPILAYSTYLGGSGGPVVYPSLKRGDQASGIAVDAAGSAYVVGTTYSTDFPVTKGAYLTKSKLTQAGYGTMIFVSKLNAAGTGLVYSTYLGGTGWDEAAGGNGDSGMAIALDAENNAYVTGNTFSADFPVTSGAYKSAATPSTVDYPNLFVTKLNAAGSALVYSATIGPGYGQGIAVDSGGNAYVTGTTLFGSYPSTSGAYQPHTHGSFWGGLNVANAVVTKLNPAGTALVYSTFLGGSGYQGYTYLGDFIAGDAGNAIAIDSTGDAYITGSTSSADFPVTPGAVQTKYAGVHASDYLAEPNTPNAFVSKLNAAGSALVYSTYLGGSGNPEDYDGVTDVAVGDQGNAIAADSAGEVTVAGSTYSTDFPVTAGVIGKLGDSYEGAGFVAKFNATGSKLDFSTYLGSQGASVNGMTIDRAGNAYLTGNAGANFPLTPDALPAQGCCVYVAKMNPDGTGLEYATLLGGTGTTTVGGLALDSAGSAYIAGYTVETDFPITAGAYQAVNKGAAHQAPNAFISKLALSGETSDYFGTAIAATSSSALIKQGLPLTVTVAVSSSAGGATPTGTVALSAASGSAAFSTTTLTLSGGAAQFHSSSLAPGLYILNVNYPGNATHLPSISSVQFRVEGPPASVNCGAGFGTRAYGQYSYFYASVTDVNGYPLQGLTVTFSGANLTFSSTSGVTDQFGNVTTNVAGLKAGTFTALVSVGGSTIQGSAQVSFSPAFLQIVMRPAARFYGGANPTFGYAILGLVGTDTVTVTPQTPATVASPVGVYDLTATVSGALASNYYPAVTDSTLTVDPATLHVEASSVSTIYGNPPPALTGYGFYGFVNGDTARVVSGAPVLSTAVTAHTAPGEYLIGVQAGTLSAPNYVFSTQGNGPGYVWVYKRPLQLVATNLTMVQGSAVPALTYSLTGFVNGDTAATSVTGAPVLTTTATSSSPPGKYPIAAAAGTLAAPNYSFTPVKGTLTVTPAPH